MSATVPTNHGDCYSPREIAQAAGVPERRVLAALGGQWRYVAHDEALRIARALRAAPAGHFSLFADGHEPVPAAGLPFAVSTTLHAGIFMAALFLTTAGLTPAGAAGANARAEAMPLIFVALPGLGGGGGGGGLVQKAPPPRARREGRAELSSPLPRREAPKPIEPVAEPEPPAPEPIEAEPLPPIVAPVVTAPADARTQAGVLDETTNENDSRGPGANGGAGAGLGTGIGEGDGEGIGPGSGGGTGGGPYRPGSGIDPPRLLREVKPNYTEEARVRRIEGEVVLEIVVRRDGSVGDVRVVRGLGAGLNDRAADAVRQWRFAPARRRGTPVDVLVEVSVDFRVR